MKISRRQFLHSFSGLGLGALGWPVPALPTATVQRAIPKSGEPLPVIGMGSWLTFAVGEDAAARAVRTRVVQTFVELGGTVIDSSPMYGSSEAVIGHALSQVKNKDRLFAASKVWTHGWQAGVRQMQRSQALWGIPRFDLMQVHNLLDVDTQLQTLTAWKAEGRIRYIGVTTSHGRRHEALIELMQQRAELDFVQFTYNITHREAESRLLPMAQERKLAVIINRPFDGGDLFEHVQAKPLPAWVADYGITSWSQYFLKFIVAHPAVTCAIPATSRVEHLRENMGALQGALPDARTRQRMLDYFHQS
jgi:diketogulonate reductase-like aldo/keto reductase